MRRNLSLFIVALIVISTSSCREEAALPPTKSCPDYQIPKYPFAENSSNEYKPVFDTGCVSRNEENEVNWGKIFVEKVPNSITCSTLSECCERVESKKAGAAWAFEVLKNPKMLESLEKKGITSIDFPGTIYQGQDGTQMILGLGLGAKGWFLWPSVYNQPRFPTKDAYVAILW